MRKLWKEYQDGGAALFGHALKLTGNVDRARDLVQEAVRRAAGSWDTFDDSRPVGPWLHTIMRRVFLDSRKSAAVRLNRSIEGAVLCGDGGQAVISLGDTLEDPSDGPERAAERNEAAAHVQRALGRVSGVHREVLRLVDMDGASNGAAAAILQLPVGTVRSRLCRAREALRRVLSPVLA